MRVGRIELQVPRVCRRSEHLGARKQAEPTLLSMIQEAHDHRISTQRVDNLVKALWLDGISKSQVSRICQELDTELWRFRKGRPEESHPLVWLDAAYVKIRQDGRVVSVAIVLATEATGTARGKCWASMSARVRTGCFGSSSCATWSDGTYRGADGDK